MSYKILSLLHLYTYSHLLSIRRINCSKYQSLGTFEAEGLGSTSLHLRGGFLFLFCCGYGFVWRGG